MSSRFEVYASAKFLSDGKRGTSGLLQAAFGGKVKVIKHNSYFGLDIHSWLRNLCLGVMDATCKFLGLGQGTDLLYFEAICPTSFEAGHYLSSVTNWASPFQSRLAGFETG